jgi:hypothetical protein
MRLRPLLLLAGIAACAPDAPRPPAAPDTAGPDTLPDVAADTASATVSGEPPLVAAWRARIPLSELVRAGACPFECCMYREWVAEGDIPVRDVAAGDAPVRFTIAAEQSFQADSGMLRVTGLSVVAVRDTFTAWIDDRPDHFSPGDTLVLLEPIGEGAFKVWFDGRVRTTEGFWHPPTDSARVTSIGRYQAEWWVHATLPDGRRGWFRADAVELRGADACA